MKIAIPLFDTRISPRFDHAQGFLLVEEENGEIIERKELPAVGLTPLTRVKKLSELGIDTLICGGIDRASAQQLSFNGVRIYSWVTGEGEDALRCFLSGGAGARRYGRLRWSSVRQVEIHGRRGAQCERSERPGQGSWSGRRSQKRSEKMMTVDRMTTTKEGR